MKKMVISAGLAVFALAAAGWYVFGPGSDMSGTYVGKNAGQAFLVQIIQGQGGQLTGFFEESALSADGTSVNQDNVPLSGQRDGKNFSVTLNPVGLAHFFQSSTSLAGTFSGSGIRLVGLSSNFSANLNLVKGNAEDYSDDVAELNNEARLTKNARIQQEQTREQLANAQEAAVQRAEAARDLETRINNDLQLSQRVAAIVAQRVQQLDEDIAKLCNDTAELQNALAKQATVGGPQSVEGGQISVAMYQLNIDEQQYMQDLKERYQDIQQNGILFLMGRFKLHDADCLALNATPSAHVAFTGPPTLLTACEELENATPTMQKETDQLEAAYQAVFTAWQAENSKQKALIQQGQQ